MTSTGGVGGGICGEVRLLGAGGVLVEAGARSLW